MSVLTKPRRYLAKTLREPDPVTVRHPVLSLLGLACLLLVVAGIIGSLPEIIRYEKIRRM